MALGVALLAYIAGASVAGGSWISVLGIILLALGLLWLVFVGLRLRRMVALVLVLLILAPAVRVTPNLPVIFGDEVLIFLTGGLLLLHTVSQARRAPARRHLGTGVLLALFIPAMVISIFAGYLGFGIEPAKGDWFELVKLAKYLLAFYVASQVRVTEGYLKHLSLVLVGVVAVSAVVSLLQVFNVGGTRLFFAQVFFGAFRSPGEAEESTVVTALAGRSAGTIGNPNDFGLILGVGLTFAGALLFSGTCRGRVRVALSCAVLLVLAALLLTGSRTALLAVMVSGAYLGVIFLFQRRGVISSSSPGYRLVQSVLFTAPIVLALVLLNIGQSRADAAGFIADRFGRTTSALSRSTYQGAKSVAAANRYRLIRRGLSEAGQSPILGYGPGEGARITVASGTTDNEPVFVLVRMGFLGLLLYVAFWFSAVRLAQSLARYSDAEAWLFGHAVVAVILLNLVAMWAVLSFFDVRRMTLTCVLLGLCAAARTAFSRAEPASKRPVSPQKA